MAKYEMVLGMALAAMIASSVMGCGGASTRPYVGGRFSEDQAQLYATATRAAQSRGYTLEEDDASRGRFSVRAHTTGRAARRPTSSCSVTGRAGSR